MVARSNDDLVRALPTVFRLGSNLFYILRTPVTDEEVPTSLLDLLLFTSRNQDNPTIPLALLAFDWGELVEAWGA